MWTFYSDRGGTNVNNYESSEARARITQREIDPACQTDKNLSKATRLMVHLAQSR